MSNQQMTPVILCGGSGTRLWPRSREERPKPFLDLIGDGTLFEQTLQRCSGQAFAPPIVITHERHVGFVEPALRKIDGAQIIVEPAAKNTAAAVALAALRLPERSVMLVTPSDHYIEDEDPFVAAAHAAARVACQGRLVAITVSATSPNTGYGYLRRGDPLDEGAFAIDRFVEKPDLATAEDFVRSGEYSWNSGIFAFDRSTYLRELATYRPQLEECARRAVAGGRADANRFFPEATAFQSITAESIDYAVMENSQRGAMVPTDMAWSDVGTWESLKNLREKDEKGNSARGPATLLNCRNVAVESDGPAVHAIGLDDVIIVVDGEDIVVTSTKASADVSTLIPRAA